MKKIAIIATVIILATTAFCSYAGESINFLNNDGSATRITFNTDSWGRTTVSSGYVTQDQRNAEELVAGIVKLLAWIFLK